ncbi:tRNA-dihydrouridine synthase [Cupriavidus basilensis]
MRPYAATLSPHGIDLNFGCPAKVVNRHGGGAMLAGALPSNCTASFPRCGQRSVTYCRHRQDATRRIGYRTGARLRHGAGGGGAASLVVHARTRDHGYRPPAHWEWIARIADTVDIPVIANGEESGPLPIGSVAAQSVAAPM